MSSPLYARHSSRMRRESPTSWTASRSATCSWSSMCLQMAAWACRSLSTAGMVGLQRFDHLFVFKVDSINAKLLKRLSSQKQHLWLLMSKMISFLVVWRSSTAQQVKTEKTWVNWSKVYNQTLLLLHSAGGCTDQLPDGLRALPHALLQPGLAPVRSCLLHRQCSSQEASWGKQGGLHCFILIV